MEADSQKRLSLDTNVLFDLADEKDFAHDFQETYQGKGYSLVLALLEIDHDTLRDVCVEADLAPVFPMSPRRRLRAIR